MMINMAFLATLCIILACIVIGLSISLITMFRIHTSQKRIIRAKEHQLINARNRNGELYLDCQTAVALLYDVVLTEGLDMEYKASIIRSSLAVLGMEAGSQYNVGALQSLIECPDIDALNKLVANIVTSTYQYDPKNIAFLDPKTFSALERFNAAMAAMHEQTVEDQSILDNYTMDVISDPLYCEVQDSVRVRLSDRAFEMIGQN